MSKRKHPAQVLVERWRHRLNLHEWTFTVVDLPGDQESDDCGADVICDINANPVYRIAKLRLYPIWYRSKPDVREFAIVHELCHCITEPLRDAMQALHNGVAMPPHVQLDLVETCTQSIAKAVLWAGAQKPAGRSVALKALAAPARRASKNRA